jgi:hypothetical protein
MGACGRPFFLAERGRNQSLPAPVSGNLRERGGAPRITVPSAGLLQ